MNPECARTCWPPVITGGSILHFWRFCNVAYGLPEGFANKITICGCALIFGEGIDLIQDFL